MAEEFQAAICGETWWNINSISRSVFHHPSSSSGCSNDAGNYSTWQTDFMDLKATRSCAAEEDTNNNFVSGDASLGFLDAHKNESAASGGTDSILMDSTLQMMGYGLSSSTSSNWNQSLFRCSGRAPEGSFQSVLQEETGMDSCDSQVSTVDAFKPMNQEFSLDQLQHQNQQSLSCVTSTELSGGLPIGSTGSYGYPSTLVQSLYEPDPQPQPQHSLFTNRPIMSYSSSTPNYGILSSSSSSSAWSNVSTLLKPKQQLNSNGLHFSNNTPFWNPSVQPLHDITPGVFVASSKAQYQTPTFEDKSNCPITLLNKLKNEESKDTASVPKESVCEPAFKRPRIETPSPLPTFKVRKEKLGDRITALQQLVSPFGKTDTASVLHEAIEYIKFLHDQVSVLSSSYMKNGTPIQQQQVSLKGCDNGKDSSEGPKQDLRSRGLCLVPISSTFPMANETTVDFWTPTFGGALMR